jgi:hypothetical protein
MMTQNILWEFNFIDVAMDRLWKVEYSTRRCIGKGGYSKVFKGRCTHKETGEVHVVAVKRINGESGNTEENARREALYLTKFSKNTNIIHMYAAYKHDHIYTLYLEFCETDLLAWLRSRREPPGEGIIRSVAQQVARGIDAIHNQGVVHRDIKPSNLLLKSNRSELFPYIVKITDFGFAVEEDAMGSTVCGTPHNMAPEILMKRPNITRQVDLYSLGTVLYHLHTKAPPVRAVNINDLRQKFSMPTPPTDRLYYPINTSIVFKDLCNRLLRVDPIDRPSIADVRRHPFLTENETDTFVMVDKFNSLDSLVVGGTDTLEQQQARLIAINAIRVTCALKFSTVYILEPPTCRAVYRLAHTIATKALDDIAKRLGTEHVCKSTEARLKTLRNNLALFSTLAGDGTCDTEVGQSIHKTLLCRLEKMNQIASDNKQYKVADALSQLAEDIECSLPVDIECSKMLSGNPLSSLEIPNFTSAVATATPINIPSGGNPYRFCINCGTRFQRQHQICSCGEIRGFSC